jgi:hypothetical protein
MENKINFIKDNKKYYYCKCCDAILEKTESKEGWYSLSDSIISDLTEYIKPLSNSGPAQIVLECEWTDFVQRLVEFGNTAFLKNFKYRLTMEET